MAGSPVITQTALQEGAVKGLGLMVKRLVRKRPLPSPQRSAAWMHRRSSKLRPIPRGAPCHQACHQGIPAQAVFRRSPGVGRHAVRSTAHAHGGAAARRRWLGARHVYLPACDAPSGAAWRCGAGGGSSRKARRASARAREAAAAGTARAWPGTGPCPRRPSSECAPTGHCKQPACGAADLRHRFAKHRRCALRLRATPTGSLRLTQRGGAERRKPLGRGGACAYANACVEVRRGIAGCGQQASANFAAHFVHDGSALRLLLH